MKLNKYKDDGYEVAGILKAGASQSIKALSA
jgi:hypothetical protein